MSGVELNPVGKFKHAQLYNKNRENRVYKLRKSKVHFSILHRSDCIKVSKY